MDERYDHAAIEAKWQRRWEEQGTFRALDDDPRPRHYVLEMFPYPSGAGLSVGHIKNYAPTDAYSRFKSMQGYNVLHPMGWDAFGQPAENEAIKRGRNPREMVPEYAASYRRTLVRAGCAYDWSREINSSLPDYYRWTQWIFLLLYRRGLAYRATAPINWCPACATGLANEEVTEGRCWRCETPVEKRPMQQWFFRITAYAQRLLDDLETIQWSDGLKEMQRDWIGRSEGAEVRFPVMLPAEAEPAELAVFTTRPDTLWGATFMVIAPEHPLVERIVTAEQRPAVEAYARRAQAETEIDRMAADRPKTGVFTGAFALNPVTGLPIPIWVADYVLMGYGTGAIMAVPAHDQRDFEFARKFDLPIELVYALPDGPRSAAEMDRALPEGGAMRSFAHNPAALTDPCPFAGAPNSKQTVQGVTQWLESQGVGKGQVQYRLRDWLISRQRYWGAPIPIVHCPACGEVPVPEDQLPVELPEVERYESTGTGESPLAAIESFVRTACPACGGPARRETDTMGGYACSSWYFLRFADPHNAEKLASRDLVDAWLPVDMYTGGVEHARSHLLYSRFWTKVLYDEGCVGFQEPFTVLRNQGSMLAWTPGRRPRADEQAGDDDAGDDDAQGGVVDWIVLKPEDLEGFPADQIVWRWARMSKSKGNVVRPDEVCERYGADSLRTYEMFVAPFEDNVQWTDEGINGAHRFVNRVWRWCVAALPAAGGAGAAVPPSEAGTRIRRKLHQTIRKVTEDLEAFRFNTAIAALMELVNELYLWRPVDQPVAEGDRALTAEALEALVLMMAPFAPHLADELWERMGRSGSTYRATWPAHDERAAADEEITVVVQVNGKLRDRLTVPAYAGEDALRALALASEKVTQALDGRPPRKVIVVPGRLVNVVG